MNVAYNMDCLEAMRQMPDNAFDLAVVDPPYGDGLHAESGGGKGWFTKYNMSADESAYRKNGGGVEPLWSKVRPLQVCRTGGQWAERYGKKIVSWDTAPEKEYFDELFRVSRNQIIWGGNYFELPPTRCFLIWRKLSITENFSMAMAEYAWTSFNGNAKVFDCAPQGKKNDPRFHPTQKPVALYEWIYRLYAKPGDKILDTHLGSGSSRIAAYKAGLDFVGYEIDKTYFDLQEKRFAEQTAQMNIFQIGAEDESRNGV